MHLTDLNCTATSQVCNIIIQKFNLIATKHFASKIATSLPVATINCVVLREYTFADFKMKQTHTLLARLFFLVLVSAHLVKQARCEHILGFASLSFVSHHRLLWKLGKELQTRGHKYTHILPNFAKETYDDVDTKIFNSSLTNEDLEDWFLNFASVGKYDKDVFAFFEVLTKIMPKQEQMHRQFCEDFLKHESLIVELKASVDLVLCDVINECCVILADMLNVIRVDVSPMIDTFLKAIHTTMGDKNFGRRMA